MRYKDFLDEAQPLLDRFKNLAPSSYKHCLNVATICESIVAELGEEIDGELLVTAAKVHDVGKLLAPQYYTENQTGDNPHDKLDPHVSYELIVRHVSDTGALLAQAHCPYEIIDVCLQHHGSSVVQWFYQKSKADSEEIFRYKWPEPQTVEAAILMIVDVIEATARSMTNKDKLQTQEDRIKLVEERIQYLSNDDQINVLTLGVVKALKKVIPKELESFHHTRIDYPKEDKI